MGVEFFVNQTLPLLSQTIISQIIGEAMGVEFFVDRILLLLSLTTLLCGIVPSAIVGVEFTVNLLLLLLQITPSPGMMLLWVTVAEFLLAILLPLS